MANYATLKAAIQSVIKQNGNNEITGALLQQSLLSMITSLGAGYQFIGVATPSTNPGTPDQNVYYLASTAGTYSNFGGIVLNSGEVAILTYDGSWTKYSSGFASEEKLNQLELKSDILKLDKKPGVNLIDPDRMLINKYINSSGGISSGTSPYRVTDYIPVNGQNIISTAYSSSNISAFAVYDANFHLLRTGTSTQYTYQSGDAYVRFTVRYSEGTTRANYGTTLAEFVQYDPYEPVATVYNDLNTIKLDKIIGTNLINADVAQKGKYLNTNGVVNTAGVNVYCVSEYIRVNGQDIISNAYISGTTIASYVVYDKNKIILRIVLQNRQYTYQEGDYYIRFTFPNYTIARANYGTTLADYEPYTDYKPIADLKKRVDNIEPLTDTIPDKLDKIYGTNLLDPAKMLQGKYINTSGGISPGTSAYRVTDYIPVNGQDIISTASVGASTILAYAVYDAERNFIRGDYQSAQYTYQSGDAYVRFTVRYSANSTRANYGTVLAAYEPYTDYKPLLDLSLRVDALDGGERTDLELTQLNKLYMVYNSVLPNRNYITKLWLSHFLNKAEYKNKEIFFENGQRYFPIYPTSVSTKTESDSGVNITPKSSYNNAQLSYKLRLTNNAASKAVKPRIMIIGDSVTSGYGANVNKTVSWLPNQYWAYAKMFFEMDKIDGGDNSAEYNALFLGVVSTGNFTINYNGVQRAVRARADGKGGASLDELFTPTWGDNQADNPFYDSVNQTFSIADYLRKYRTMDDLGVRLVSQSTNPAGESVVGSDGLTYTIGTQITSQSLLSQYDVCKPTHIVINMVHNTSLANYQTYAPQVISIIQSELPGVPIVLATIDETGTYFPVDFPDYVESQINITSLHSKNLSIYNWIKQNVENETNGIYLLGLNFVQPTARSLATVNYISSDSVEKSEKEIGLNVVDPVVSGANYHPNNYAHAAWGYTLYSMLKWLIS